MACAYVGALISCAACIAAALAALRAHDRPLHDALVRLLVADALEHALDVPPWCVHA